MNIFTQFVGLLQTVPIASLHLTGLDILIIFIFIFYAIEGYSIGFIQALLDFVSFVLSFLVGLKGYTIFALFLSKNFSIPLGFSNAIGFFVASALSEVVFGLLARNISHHISRNQEGMFQKANKWLGIIPSLLSAFVLLSFLLTLIISLPISPFLKHTIAQSKIGSLFVINTTTVEKTLSSIFGQAVNDTLNFLTVEPQSNEIVKLHFTTEKIAVDENAEKYMLVLINKERTSRHLEPVVMDTKLTNVARDHSKDMFERGYFSHYTPDGLTPFDRMSKANIPFTSAGENLALSPNTDLAMQGLMQSPGHKANILSPDFHKVGVGIIDGGIYGEMFAQEFTD